MSNDLNRRGFLKQSVALSAGVASSISLEEKASAANLPQNHEQNVKTKLRKDMRSEPVKRMVVMGESNAYGMAAGDPRNEWVQTLANLLRQFQDEPLRVFNNSLPGNVISPDAPGYLPIVPGFFGTSPSAIERYEQDMISYKPDMVVYAYGLNDSRCGHKLESFMKAYRHIVRKTREKLPDALIVLVGPYWCTQYDPVAWSVKKRFPIVGDQLVLAYNKAISELADEYGAIFVDVYRVLEGALWLLNKDDCHFNDLGQSIIGQTIFIEIAAHCFFVAKKSKRMEKELNLNIRNTGGTQALPNVISSWRKMDRWK